MKYKHIIWDWNGTLLDDRLFCIEIMNQVLQKRGMKAMSESWFLDNFCFPVKDYYIKLGFDFNKESIMIILPYFVVYCKHFLKKVLDSLEAGKASYKKDHSITFD